MTGPKNATGETTWGGLADEVRYWGNWILKKVKTEIGDLYPLIPDPDCDGKKLALYPHWFKDQDSDEVPAGQLIPVAYLWTRTVKCKNPSCGATVPLVKQTWLCNKDGRYVAMKIIAPTGKKEVRFEVVEAPTQKRLGFDPTSFSKAGNTACPFCGTVADSDYVKAEGCAGRMGQQLMTTVCENPAGRNKKYVQCAEASVLPSDRSTLLDRANSLAETLSVTIPDEPLEANPRSFDVQRFGFVKWRDILSSRQLIAMLAFCGNVRCAYSASVSSGARADHAEALCVHLVVY